MPIKTLIKTIGEDSFNLHYRPSGLVHELSELNVAINHLAVLDIASVHFDKINSPVSQALSVGLQMVNRAGIACASFCSVVK